MPASDEQQANHLAATFREEIEVVGCGNATNSLISGPRMADSVLLGHFGSVEGRSPEELLVEIVEGTERRKTSPVNNKDLAEQMAGMGPGEGKEVHLSPILH